jgi:hypothetical protein
VLEDEAGKFSLVAQLSTVPTKTVQALLSLPWLKAITVVSAMVESYHYL